MTTSTYDKYENVVAGFEYLTTQWYVTRRNEFKYDAIQLYMYSHYILLSCNIISNIH